MHFFCKGLSTLQELNHRTQFVRDTLGPEWPVSILGPVQRETENHTTSFTQEAARCLVQSDEAPVVVDNEHSGWHAGQNGFNLGRTCGSFICFSPGMLRRGNRDSCLSCDVLQQLHVLFIERLDSIALQRENSQDALVEYYWDCDG